MFTAADRAGHRTRVGQLSNSAPGPRPGIHKFSLVNFAVCDSYGFPPASVDVMLLICGLTWRACSPC
jgi:hypothetical protein